MAILALAATPSRAAAQIRVHPQTQSQTLPSNTTQSYNQSLLELAHKSAPGRNMADDYRIGPDDLLEVSVFGAPDLGRTVRVAGDGSVSLPLVGEVNAAGLTSRELEGVIGALLRRNYIINPQVGVFVKEMESHAVSVLGAVGKPGVYQIHERKTLIEVLSMAQGLANDAGDKVIVIRRSGATPSTSANPPDPRFAEGASAPLKTAKPESLQPMGSASDSVEIDLKELLSSADAAYNVVVYPGDVVKVPRAGIVYVVGEVKKPGGFLLRTNENISVLQALALAEGTTKTSNEKGARIIRTGEGGTQQEIRLNLKGILSGKATDPPLLPRDILFIPNSSGKTAFYRGTEAALSITGGLIVYRW